MNNLLVFLALVTSNLATAASTFTAPVIWVHDGDTLTVTYNSTPRKVRLFGVDAPEAGQDGCRAARDALRDKTLGKTVQVKQNGVSYGRIVGRVYVGTTDVSTILLEEGYARVDQRYTKRKEYLLAEQKARAANAGIWGKPDAVPPWQWRRENSSRGKECF